MTLEAANATAQTAGHLIEAVLGQSQRAQAELGMKLARLSLSQNLGAPPSTSDASGAGTHVDLLG